MLKMAFQQVRNAGTPSAIAWIMDDLIVAGWRSISATAADAPTNIFE
jgi:hypothetical protein